ncbi:DUF4190 domain-containing protein [Arenivirga flava]|uniref:DUF4190 domain-containing protein n=1 Tax=Arenivirga flava TaxID=1930060 RepID=A0AA37UG13_9MICO|nr:DUF4190 domain-containing protein [Arenivirga flava]GMA28174.1 hypothetical protein GCM10025874_14270 [Arenivirga flava]
MSDPNNPSEPRPEQNAAPTPPPYSPPAGEAQNPYAAPEQPQQHAAPPENPYAQPEQPYASAPAYGYQQQGQKTNTLAIVSLIASLAGLITGISAIVGIITGHIALSQIKKTGENGRGLALGGLITGYVLTALTIIGIIAAVVFFSWAATQPEFTYDY